MKWLDGIFERSSRRVAQRNGRRSVLSRTGKILVGAAFAPLLPVDRLFNAGVAQAAEPSELPKGINDPQSCDYWKYCAIDGWLCSCCGGTSSSCPPGTTPSPITWIGTCRNPADGRDYVVSYNDCCGKSSCGSCLCNSNQRERPLYKLSLNNDINWCMANTESNYHCSTSVLLGVADK